MIPVNQFILGSSDPLLYPSEKMTNSIDEQIAFLQSQKQAINEAYRRNAIPNANNGVTQISKFQLKEFGMLLMLKLHHLHKNNKICFLITKTM